MVDCLRIHPKIKNDPKTSKSGHLEWFEVAIDVTSSSQVRSGNRHTSGDTLKIVKIVKVEDPNCSDEISISEGLGMAFPCFLRLAQTTEQNHNAGTLEPAVGLRFASYVQNAIPAPAQCPPSGSMSLCINIYTHMKI